MISVFTFAKNVMMIIISNTIRDAILTCDQTSMSQLNVPHGTNNYNNNNDRLTAFDPGQPG